MSFLEVDHPLQLPLTISIKIWAPSSSFGPPILCSGEELPENPKKKEKR
jgi:hypothetical protein